MTTELFTEDQFKDALTPFNTYYLGPVGGELCWLVPVTNSAGVLVRSSVDPYYKVAKATGDDSIRVYPIACSPIDTLTGRVWVYHLQGTSDGRWTTREPGWQKRMQGRIQGMVQMVERAGNCSVCGKPLAIRKVKKEGPNKGRWFASCANEHHNFVWLDKEVA